MLLSWIFHLLSQVFVDVQNYTNHRHFSLLSHIFVSLSSISKNMYGMYPPPHSHCGWQTVAYRSVTPEWVLLVVPHNLEYLLLHTQLLPLLISYFSPPLSGCSIPLYGNVTLSPDKHRPSLYSVSSSYIKYILLVSILILMVVAMSLCTFWL